MIRIDPRTKIALLILTVIFSMTVPSGWYACAWIILIMLTGILLGRCGRTIRSAVIFCVLYLFSVYGLPQLTGTLHTSLLVWLGLVFKCYPSCMLAGVVIGTTHISEFMAAMSKMKLPKAIIIPMAIMFRYFPVVKEDWGFIRDAMALRGITFSPLYCVKNPELVIDALYVPILTAASKAADELSVAAITRGIENPEPRTNRLDIRFSAWDGAAAVTYLAVLAVLIGRCRLGY